MKKLKCGDLVPGCPKVIEAGSDEEIIAAAGNHVVEAHGMEVTPELVEQVRGAINDVDGPETR